MIICKFIKLKFMLIIENKIYLINFFWSLKYIFKNIDNIDNEYLKFILNNFYMYSFMHIFDMLNTLNISYFRYIFYKFKKSVKYENKI